MTPETPAMPELKPVQGDNGHVINELAEELHDFAKKVITHNTGRENPSLSSDVSSLINHIGKYLKGTHPIFPRSPLSPQPDVEGKCSKTGIKYSDAITELQDIFSDCDLYGAKAKHPTSVRVRVLSEAVIEAATGRLNGVAPEKVEGWKLVPIEVTEEMYDAADMDWPEGRSDQEGISFEMFKEMYAAMLDAAPLPPTRSEPSIPLSQLKATLEGMKRRDDGGWSGGEKYYNGALDAAYVAAVKAVR